MSLCSHGRPSLAQAYAYNAGPASTRCYPTSDVSNDVNLVGCPVATVVDFTAADISGQSWTSTDGQHTLTSSANVPLHSDGAGAYAESSGEAGQHSTKLYQTSGSRRLSEAYTVRVNFQPDPALDASFTETTPADYVIDSGEIYGRRSGGAWTGYYGWNCDLSGVHHWSTNAGVGPRFRSGQADIVLATMVVPDRYGSKCSAGTTSHWEIDIGQGTWDVEVVTGDAEYASTVSGCTLGSSGGTMHAFAAANSDTALTDNGANVFATFTFTGVVLGPGEKLRFAGNHPQGCETVNSISVMPWCSTYDTDSSYYSLADCASVQCCAGHTLRGTYDAYMRCNPDSWGSYAYECATTPSIMAAAQLAAGPFLLPGSSATKASSRCGGSSAGEYGATFTSEHGELNATFSAESNAWVVAELGAYTQCAGCAPMDSTSCKNAHTMTNASLQAIAAWYAAPREPSDDPNPPSPNLPPL